MLKIYPSSFAPPAGNTLNAQYKESCPRYFAWSKTQPQEKFEIPLLYRAVGLLAELRQKLALNDAEYEVPVKREISPGVIVSGRVDILTPDCVYEIKATTSRSKFDSHIRKGIVLPTHLGQLVTYLALLGRSYGEIHWSYLHFNKARTAIEFETVKFAVRLEGDNVYVNDNLHPQGAVNMLSFYRILADAVQSGELPPRTSNENACKSCPFAKICDKGPKDLTEFFREVSTVQTTRAEGTREPELHCHDIRRTR